MKKKNGIGKIIFLVIAAILVIGFIIIRVLSSQASKLPFVDVTVIPKVDLVNSISVDGTVESNTKEQIFSKLSLPIKESLVKVGDKVKAGDVLAELDTKDIEDKLASQRTTISVAEAQNGQNIATAQRSYNFAAGNFKNDKDSTTFQAEQTVENARQGVVRAEQALAQAEVAVEKAALTFRGTANAVTNARSDADWNGVEIRDSQVDPLTNQREQAYLGYEQAKVAVEDAKVALETAKQGVVDSEYSLEITRNSIEQQLVKLQDSVATAQVSARSVEPQRLSLSQLEDSLKDGKIVSPINGVVTAVYAVEGALPTGVLYVIEDTQDLKVITSVKEYDMASIAVGDEVEIRSDIAGDDVYQGTLRAIDPTSVKGANGTTANPNDPEFKAEVNISGKDTKLRIGNKARLNIIYEKKADVLAVPFGALGVNAKGEEVVYILELEVEGIYKAKEIPVTVGVETDFEAEISSDQLKEGDEIIASAQGISDGMRVQKKPDSVVAMEAAISEAMEENGGGMGMTIGAVRPAQLGWD